MAIFLPSFLLVPALGPLTVWMRQRPWARRFVEGANAAAVGLIAAALAALAQAGASSLGEVLLAMATLVVLSLRPQAAPITVLAGAGLGLIGALGV